MQIISTMRKFSLLILYSLSICIGVASVLIINAISNYCVNSASLTLDRMGINGYTLSSKLISNTDILQLNNCKQIEYISPIVTITYKNENNDKYVYIGGNSQIKEIYSINIEKGSFYGNNHIYDSSNVCVISSNFANKLFKTTNCIGQSININIKSSSDKLIIVGVYTSDKLTTSTEINQSEPIYVPYTFLNAINKQNSNNLILKSYSNIDVNHSTKFITDYCESIFGTNNYSLNNTALERDRINTLMNLIKQILEIIVGVSIIVSVLGLMVITIINIRNNNKEIGLKKALGANDFTIIKEISIESSMITIVGITNGLLLYKLISLIFNQLKTIDLQILIIVPTVTIICSLLIGVIPAIIAAKVNPAVALKSEK